MVSNQRAVDAMAQGVEFVERANPTTPAANKIHLFAKDKSGVPVLYCINDAGSIYELTEVTPTFIFTVPDILITGTHSTLLIPALVVTKPCVITKGYGYVKTVNTGANLIVDINKNGVSIWNITPANRLTIPAADADGKATQTSFDTTALVEEDILTMDLDAVGSTIAGADLTVQIKTK